MKLTYKLNFIIINLAIMVSCFQNKDNLKAEEKSIIDSTIEIKNSINDLETQKSLSDTLFVIASEKRFKNWLRDTLIILPQALEIQKNNHCLKDYNINVQRDSTYLSITKNWEQQVNTYPLRCDSTKGEINAVLETILTQDKTNNSTLLAFPFHIFLTIEHYYSPSLMERLNTEQSTEVKRLLIKKDNRAVKYTIIKGNLISKETLNP